MDKKTPVHLAIRVSGMDKIDPFTELIKITDKSGEVWFGKYGRRVDMRRIRRDLFDKEAPGSLLLVWKRKGLKTGLYDFRWFDVKEVSFRKPEQGTYPNYYNQYIHRISMWFLLRTPQRHCPDISELFTESSGMPLTDTLSYSMSAHFFCRARG